MIRQTLSLVCDSKGCRNEFTGHSNDFFISSTELVKLAAAGGWDVVHPLDVEPEIHLCPDHKRTDGGSKLIRNISEDELR